MKEGYYTILNGVEYKIEQRQSSEIFQDGPRYIYPYRSSESSKFETVIVTEDESVVDNTFYYDEENQNFVKVIDPQIVADVVRYGISYYYKGHKVGKLGGRDNFITIFLDYKDRDLALRLGFTEHDRTEFIKTVDASEVEMKQEGPYSASSWY